MSPSEGSSAAVQMAAHPSVRVMTDWPRLTLCSALVVSGAILLAACGASGRPTRAEWSRTWHEIQQVIPSPDQLRRPVDQQTCRAVLADLRRRRPDLAPAPDEVIGTAAEAWITHAEHLFFKCFDPSEPEESIREGYATLRRLRAEVLAALQERPDVSPGRPTGP